MMPWGMKITGERREGDKLVVNVQVTRLRLAALVVEALWSRVSPIARIVAGVVLLALGVALLSGCPMPAPDGCSPGSRRCHEDTPQVCSPGQRWTPADVTCSTVNAQCVVRDGVPACLRGEQ
jgi:hypothetical protein